MVLLNYSWEWSLSQPSGDLSFQAVDGDPSSRCRPQGSQGIPIWVLVFILVGKPHIHKKVWTVFLSEVHCLLRPGTGCSSVPGSPSSGSLGKHRRQQEGRGEGAFYSSDLGLDPSCFSAVQLWPCHLTSLISFFHLQNGGIN